MRENPSYNFKVYIRDLLVEKIIRSLNAYLRNF